MNLEEFKNAGVIAEEVAPEVKYFIYVYKDKALNRYNPPFINDKEPAFMVDGLKQSVLKGSAKPEQITGLEFCFVGTFELSTGLLEKFDKPVVLVDCDLFLEKFGGDNNGSNCL